MADARITELTANTTPAVTDLLVIEDDPGGTPDTQKITIENLLKVVNDLTADGSPDKAADYLLAYDTSAGAAKKVLMSLVDSGGWTEISDTWTYASASTITVPSDATTIYSKGMKIRFKQGGSYKYGVVRVVAATLLTIVVNTDYTVANSAITDIAISYADRPDGFPTSFAFTCNLTASTTSPTGLTTTASYVVFSWGIKCFVSSVAGASPTNGSGYYIWEVPFTSSKSNIAGPLHISDATVGRFAGSVVQSGTVGSGGRILAITSAGLVSNASPIATLAINDSFDFSVELLW